MKSGAILILIFWIVIIGCNGSKTSDTKSNFPKKDLVLPEAYDTLTKKQGNKAYLKFVKKQYDFGTIKKEKLGWNKKMLYAIAATGNKMLNKAGDIASASDSDHPLVKSRSESGSGSGWKNCSCSTKQDFCDLTGEFQQRCKEDAGCKLDFIDCGWFRRQACDGNCRHLWA